MLYEILIREQFGIPALVLSHIAGLERTCEQLFILKIHKDDIDT